MDIKEIEEYLKEKNIQYETELKTYTDQDGKAGKENRENKEGKDNKDHKDNK